MKKHLSTLILLIILIAGAAIMLYPTVSDYWNSFHQSRAIASYSEAVALMTQEDYDRLWAEAESFNDSVRQRNNSIELPEQDVPLYNSILNISGTGTMGYIEIPKISVSLPIYHGTDESVLQVAIGHLNGTSLPTGGESNHCVLSGHRGLPSAKLLTDLDKMTEGDLFVLQVLNRTLTYQIDQIRIVEPQELQDLQITQGQDYCTLITCTPYGINSHRMLVRGVRTENLSNSNVHVTADALRIDPILVVPFAAAPMLLILLAWVIFSPGKYKDPQ